ncbi:Las17-binding protein actin regulator [Gillisia sp. Hel_I_86]|uniref:lipid-binding SYLF domain-containing protein n=1 Tax=Gillisia sp. Hel_I_86 TaxID=1249981 RepID=UPI0011990225|nr:lipid-binding SYLF domain-containing protein [Gillisia sp. Hel_I_86]TVZ26145.1 Las17-binding protein actin regulator [Gillisia sp. Hel_I_86]
MKVLKTSLVALMVITMASCGTSKNTAADIMADSRDAKASVSANNPEIAALFNNSVGYAIFPNVGKGAYIIGAASGNGTVYEKGNLVGYASLKQVDIGLQAGGKAFIEVIFFQTQQALDDFKKGNYELSANASAVLLEEGVSRDVEFRNGVGIVTKAKAGAMAGISVGGQKFDFDPI